MRDMHAFFGLAESARREVTFEVCCTILMCFDLRAIEKLELGGDDFEEVLEHVLPGFCLSEVLDVTKKQPRDRRLADLPDGAIERVSLKPELFLHLLALLLLVVVILIIPFKCEHVDCVPKIMLVFFVLQVWHELVYVHEVGLEGATGRQMNVSNNFIDTQTAGDVASFH